MARLSSALRYVASFIFRMFDSFLGKSSGSHSSPLTIKQPFQAHVPVRIRRAQIVEVEYAGHAFGQCTLVYTREKDGRLACAIVHEREKDPRFWMAVPHLAAELAMDPIKRPCETTRWILMSYTRESRQQISFEVWEAAVSRANDGSLMFSWSEARPEYAAEWSHRVETTMDLAARISIRPSTANGKVPAA